MDSNPKAVDDARASPVVINHTMGPVMKRCGGRVDPAAVRSFMEGRLYGATGSWTARDIVLGQYSAAGA